MSFGGSNLKGRQGLWMYTLQDPQKIRVAGNDQDGAADRLPPGGRG